MGSWNDVDFKIFVHTVSELSLSKYHPSPADGSISESSESRKSLESDDEEGEESCSFVKDSCSPVFKDTCINRTNEEGTKVVMQNVGGIKVDMQINDDIECLGGSKKHTVNRCSTLEFIEPVGIHQIAPLEDFSKATNSLHQGVVNEPNLNGLPSVKGPSLVGKFDSTHCDPIGVDSEGTISDPLGQACKKAKFIKKRVILDPLEEMGVMKFRSFGVLGPRWVFNLVIGL
ncbi:hypothetical protein COLO4_30030 [Corchorus olitorius]|uniref:Uncharacterized protein n=1 Tax=Corchorus olitorius TaxID=93759 RepID=A0A1R3HBP9_9ROSI|nr:hypothetical protein COLO4_30030 [Corchorus olitorius]